MKRKPVITNIATKTTLNGKVNEGKGEIPNDKINEGKGEIPNITNLATTAALKAKINEVKGEIDNITNLASTTAITAIENKIPNVSNLVKQTDYNTKNSQIVKRKLLIMTMISILLLQNLIS